MQGDLPGAVSLPIDAVLDELRDHPSRNLVLEAPPGAGKTTRVPLALLKAAWRGDGRILMLEPRRLAARAAADRMAKSLGEAVGETVGYRIRMDSKVGPRTRIEVVTEGILTRMIQDDPGLDGVAAVIFDEFHERSLNADLGLAFCLEAQAGLRDDLHILVMSATLDGQAVARLMGDAPVITSRGRSFPVEIRWLDKPPAGRFEEAMARLIERAIEEEPDGDILAFLPGQAEIRRVESRLTPRSDVLVAPLFGEMSQAAQDAALTAEPGRRKLVLATNIAETSLTIPGIRIVVDGGLARQPRFDPNGAMTRLVTLPIAKASAEQRAGRAGRTAPGVCYRLWTEAEHRGRAAFASPEIADADLAPLALEMARWGWTGETGAFLDPPPPAALGQARALLKDLGALEADGRISRHGRAMADLPLPPRLAHMVIEGRRLGLGGLAADLAALLSERDLLRGRRDADLHLRLETLHSPGASADRGTLMRVRELARQLRRLLKIPAGEPAGLEATGLLLAFAYPDRIARRRGPQDLHYLLSGGRGAHFDEPEPLATSEWLVVAELDGNKRDARVFLAAAVSLADLEEHFGQAIEESREVSWDSRSREVVARRRRRLGALTIGESRLADPAPGEITAALLTGIAEMGLACLPWSEAAQNLRQRIAFLRRLEEQSGAQPTWPDCSDAALLADLPAWLGPWLNGASRRAHLDRLDMHAAISGLLSWEQVRALDRLAPSHIPVPSGSRLPVDYGDPDRPVLAVRLQEMFGLADTPAIADGRVQLTLHLLSPARRPVQVTRDLASFWANAYKAVKADLKGQYPKHYWPDNPLEAEPTARAKPRR